MDVSGAHIVVRDLVARYSGDPVLSGVGFAVPQNSVLTILGPNGAGKSTLLRCLMGLMAPEAGEILVEGMAVGAMTATERARRLALVSQSEQSAFALSVLEIVLTGRAAHLGLFDRPGKADMALAAEALGEMGIGHLAGRSFAELSGGQRQLVRIARALVQGSRILVLDEPTTHLDLANQMQVLRAIGRLVERGRTVVMTSHDPEHAFVCGGHALVLGRNRSWAFGEVGAVLDAAALSALYEVPVCLIETADGDVIVATQYGEARRKAGAAAA